MFSVLHVANRSRRHSDGADSVDTSIDGSYVISADTTDRHISVWSVAVAFLIYFSTVSCAGQQLQVPVSVGSGAVPGTSV